MRWSLLVLFVAIPRLVLAEPKVAIAPLDGDEGGKVSDVVAEAASERAKVTRPARVEVAMRSMGVSVLSAKTVKKLRAKLDVDVVVYGSVERDGGSKRLSLSVDGGGNVKRLEVDFKAPKDLKKDLGAKLAKRIGGAMEGNGDDEDEEDEAERRKEEKRKREEEERREEMRKREEEERRKEEMRKREEEERRKEEMRKREEDEERKRKKRRGDDEDDDDRGKRRGDDDDDRGKRRGDDDDDRGKRRNDDDDRSGVMRGKRGDDDDDRGRGKRDDDDRSGVLRGKRGDDDSDRGRGKRGDDDDRASPRDDDDVVRGSSRKRRGDDDDDRRGKRVADEDEDDDNRARKRFGDEDEDELDEDEDDDRRGKRRKKRGKRHALTQTAAWLDGGGAFARRTLTYDATGTMAPPPVGTAAPAGRLEGELYPGAFSSVKSIAAGFGVYGHYTRAFALGIRVPNTQVTAPVKNGDGAFGARYRFAFGQHSLALGVAYWKRYYLVDRSALMMGQTLDMPDVNYTAIAPGVAVRIGATPKIAAFMTFDFPLMLFSGPIQDPVKGYGSSKILAFDLRGGVQYVVTKHVALQVGLEIDQVGLTFTKQTGSMSVTRNVSKATDRSIGLAATVGVSY